MDESKHKLQLLPEISEAKTMLKSMKSNVSGKVIDYGNGTSIDTNDVIYIENGPNYHTYTFNIIRENAPANAPLENLVLSPLSDGTYREILVSYYITDQEKEILRSGGTVDTKNKVTYQSLETGSFQSGITSKTQDCHLEINFYYTECSENLHSHGEQYPKCKADQPSELVYVITEVCTDTSGGSDNPWDPNFPDLPGSGGSNEDGGSSTPCNGNGVLTGPQTPASGIGYDSGDGCTGIPTSPNISSTFSLYINSLPLNLKDLLTNPMNTDFYNGLSNYFYANNGSNDAKKIIAWAAQFKIDNITITWQEFEPMLMFSQKFLQENPDTLAPNEIFQRIKALDNALTLNPNLLLDIPCNKIDDWKPIADHQIPQSVKNKLKDINSKTHWYQDDLIIQNLDNAKGKSLNMDLFSVKISKMPNKPGTSEKFTHKEFFDYFRLHLNDFAEKFTPVVDTDLGVNDTALWNSTNPLNALISIYIPVIVGHNNGTVICSGVTSNTWVFTTITSPWDSEHPVSGNRFFSYYINPGDNAMYIYTRGLDRVNLPIFNNLSVDSNPAFNGADELWSGMQAKIKKFVKDHGGTENDATIISPEIYRPDWVKVKDYFKGNKPLSSLGCK